MTGTRGHPLRRSDRRLLLASATCVLAFAVVTASAVAARATGTDAHGRGSAGGAPILWVATDGDDAGAGSRRAPLRTVQEAIARAVPGSTVVVTEGQYPEPLETVGPGAPGAPITLRGRGAALVGGGDTGRILQIRHDHWRVEHLELRGRDTAIWVEGARDVTIRANRIHDFRGECVRVKYLSSDVVVARNDIRDCGTDDFVDGGSGKNGEGVYIGTAPEQLDRNPTPVPDTTTDVRVRDNVIETRGNECVDIKEAATANVVEHNDCTGQRDEDSAGLDSRGSGNVFRFNRSYDNTGAGIRLGGDTATDGIDNVVVGNELLDNEGAGIKAMRLPQARVCGNRIEGSGDEAVAGAAIDNPSCDRSLRRAGPRTTRIGPAR